MFSGSYAVGGPQKLHRVRFRVRVRLGLGLDLFFGYGMVSL